MNKETEKIIRLNILEKAVRHMPLTCYDPEIGYVYSPQSKNSCSKQDSFFHTGDTHTIEEVRQAQVENYLTIMRRLSE